MGPTTDHQTRMATGGLGTLPQVEHTSQVGVVPAADQQHWPPQQLRCYLVVHPSLRIGGIAAQPAQAHASWIQPFQQGRPLLQKGSALQAAADLPPAVGVVAPAAAFGGQLQRPAQPQPPPVGAALAGPVEPLIQPRHGGREAVGEGIIAVLGLANGSGIRLRARLRARLSARLRASLRLLGQEQLGETLVGEAVGAHATVGVLQIAGPAHRGGAIGSLAGKAAELTFGIAAAPHVLHGYQEALGRVPGRVGIGHGGGDRPAVGLAHQQHRPGADPVGPVRIGSPEPGGQPDPVRAGHPQILGGLHSAHVGAVQADHIGGEHLSIDGAKALAGRHPGDRFLRGGRLAAGIELLELLAEAAGQGGVLFHRVQHPGGRRQG